MEAEQQDPNRQVVVETEAGVKWSRVLPQADLSPNSQQLVDVGQVTILLVNYDAKIFAIENLCPHLRLPLKGAKITEDCGIACPWHHSAFDLQNGDVKAWAPWPPVVGTVLGAVRRKRTLRVWPTRLEDGYIWVAV